MAANDADFDEMLQQFMEQYGLRSALIEKHLSKVCKLLKSPPGLVETGVKFQFITSRIKKISSAIESLKRWRNDRMERQNLKERMEIQGRDWERYWTEHNKPYRIPDYGPFPNYETMFENLHDIGGARVLVYFPGDVERVVNFLQKHPQINVVRVLRRGQGLAPEMFALERYVNQLEQKPEQEIISENMFSGYRATHIHVELNGDAIPDAHPNPNRRVLIEIQVATVVMNAWSQVEHDIIYKPAGAKPTQEERRILDTFNGIVMTGESALGILEESFERKKQARINDTNSYATGMYDFGAWIEKHCADKSIHPLKKKRSQAWKYLDMLLDVLQAAEEHTSGKLRELINHLSAGGVSDIVFSNELPLFLMKQLYDDEPKSTNEITWPDKSQATVQFARFLALRVVQSLNMAAYMGIEHDFLHVIEESLPKDSDRPSMIDFLDILHPQQPRLDWKSEEKLIKFCEAFLDRGRIRAVIPASKDLRRVLMELPVMLVEMGRIAFPRAPGNECSDECDIIVQRSLCTLLSDCEHAHWVPELCYVASDWRHHSDQEIHLLGQISEPSEEREVTPLLLPAESSTSTTNARRKRWAAAPGQDLGVLTYEKNVGRARLKLQVGEKHPTTWWEIQVGDGNNVVHEYHANKQASRPRAHPGQFRAVLGGESLVPKWEYMISKPEEWGIRQAKIAYEHSGLRIEKISRLSEFVDFAVALIPLGTSTFSTLRQGDNSEYALTIGDAEFCLQSLESQFVLHKKYSGAGMSDVGEERRTSQSSHDKYAPRDRPGPRESQVTRPSGDKGQTAIPMKDGQNESLDSDHGAESQTLKEVQRTEELHTTGSSGEETSAPMWTAEPNDGNEGDHGVRRSTPSKVQQTELPPLDAGGNEEQT